jgi:integrase/recombinase XerD
MEELFEQFVQEKTYLKNVTKRTVGFYRQSFKAFKKRGGQLSKEGLNHFIITMRQSGISPVTCNVYIRGVNSFLSWLHENNHTTERLKAKQLKEETKVLKTFSEPQLRLLVSYKPKGVYESRLHALICLLVDPGIRIEEALSLERTKVNFEDLLITVHGKGNKERTIPISIECRKVLFKFLRNTKWSLVFCPRSVVWDIGQKVCGLHSWELLGFLRS